MTYYSMKDYKLAGFEPSNRTNKKYTAVLQQNKKNNKYIYIHFGAIKSVGTPYQQYYDKIGNYKHFNHYDKKRRDRYISRHKHFIKEGFYSPGYFAMRYLW